MPYDEPHAAVLKALTTEAPWLAIGERPQDARRLALLCAIAWTTGATTGEMSRLRLCDWMPDGAPAIRLTRAIVDERADGGRNPRPRLAPALPVLTMAVERRLEDMRGAGPETFLLARAPKGKSPRGFIEASGPRIGEASHGAVESVIDLAKRHRLYLTWSGQDSKIVWWASGSLARVKNVKAWELSR